MRISFSANNVPIRLSKERFEHIASKHPEMRDSERGILETINNPDMVQRGDAGTLLAIKKFHSTPVSEDKFLVAVYKEVDQADGFLLTAHFSNKLRKRMILWKR